MAHIARDLAARRAGPAGGRAVQERSAGRHLQPHRRSLRGRPHARGGRAGRSRRLLSRLRGRGDRPLLPHDRGDGRQRGETSRRPQRRRHGRLCRHDRGADLGRLSRLVHRQDRALGSGAGAAAGAEDPGGHRHRRDGPERSRLRPYRDRDDEAVLCRPRGLLRRPPDARRADGGAAVGRLCRGPSRPDRRPRVAAPAPRHRAGVRGSARPHPVAAGRPGQGRGL